MKKKRTKKYNPNRYRASSEAIEIALKSNTTENSESVDADMILAPMYAAVMKLKGGFMDQESYVQLCELNTFGYNLACLLLKGCDHELSDIIATATYTYGQAADAIANIASRKLRIGRYAAGGDEIKVIQEGIGWSEQLLGLANRGMVMRALISASHSIRRCFKNGFVVEEMFTSSMIKKLDASNAQLPDV